MNRVTPEQYQSASEIADLVATREISALEILISLRWFLGLR